MNTNHKPTKTEHDRLKNGLNFSSFKEEPTILLSCAFRPQPNSVEDIFNGDSEVVGIMENPPRFRKMGWDLQTLDRAKPVAGEYLEVTNGKRKLLRLYRDGQHTFAAGIDFFGHGVNRETNSRDNLNLLSIAECISNFVVFSRQISDKLNDKSGAMIFTIVISNPNRESLKLHAYDGISTEEVGILNLEWAEHNVIVVNPDTMSDMKIAYQIYAELCYFFGIRTDQFWYVNKVKQEIDKEAFIRQG
ncbi:MAG: hypothetical protein AAB914_02325 [Patescibacteria group bacterium]